MGVILFKNNICAYTYGQFFHARRDNSSYEPYFKSLIVGQIHSTVVKEKLRGKGGGVLVVSYATLLLTVESYWKLRQM